MVMDPEISKWTCDEVGAWLCDVGYEKYVKFFAENQMDGQNLLTMTTDDLFLLVKCFNDIFKLGDILKFRAVLVPLQRQKKRPESGFGRNGYDTAWSTSPTPTRQVNDRASSPITACPTDQQPENPIEINPSNAEERNENVACIGDAITDHGSLLSFEGGLGGGDANGAIIADNWHTYNDSEDVVIWGENEDSTATMLTTPSSAEEINLSTEIPTPLKVAISTAEQAQEPTPTGLGGNSASFSASTTPKIQSSLSSPDGSTNITMPGQTCTIPEQEYATNPNAPAAAAASMEESNMMAGANDEKKQVSISPAENQGRGLISTPTQNSAVATADSMASPAVAAKTPPKMSAAASFNPDLTRRESNASTASSTPSPPSAPAQSCASPQAPPNRRPALPSYHLSRAHCVYRYPSIVTALPEVGKTFRAYISYAESPLEFSIQTEKSYDQVRKIGGILNNFYERDPYVLPLPPEMVLQGTACAAKFEGDWYRAIIEKVLKDDQILVRYVDFGNTETLPRRALMALKRDRLTEQPAQSIDLRLAGIPQNLSITSAQRDDFYDMVEPMQKTFLVKIDCYADRGPHAAYLTDSVSNQSLNMVVQRLLGIPVATGGDVEPLRENMDPNGDANELDEAFWNAVTTVSSDEDDD